MPAINSVAKRNSGQSLVEFVLLMGVVVGGAAIFQSTLLPYITSLVSKQKDAAEQSAWKGGAVDLRTFYRNGCGKKRPCQ